MTKLNINVTITNSCVLEVTDISGFKSTLNPDGFTPEASTPIISDEYRISNGFFINILLYNKFNTSSVQVSNDSYNYKSANTVNLNYVNNFPKDVYKLTKDGSYTLKRYFFISKAFYTEHIASGIFAGKTIVYVNENKLYKIVLGVETLYPFSEFMNDNLNNFTGIVKSVNFITTCQLDKCYFGLEQDLLNKKLSCLPYSSKNRDIVYMTLNVIEYLKQLNNSTEIQRIIEDLDACGNNICLSSNNSDCGCN